MKKIAFLLLGALIVGILFTGCKDDEEDDGPSGNYMKYGDTEYELSQGFLENYGKFVREPGYNLDLTFISSGFTVHESDGEIDSLSGTGHGIYFEMFTVNNNRLEIMTYQYDPDETEEAGTFDYADGVLDYNIEAEEGTMFYIDQGTVTVSKNEGEYEISFDCRDEDGAAVTGYYKGTLKYYDYDVRTAKIKEGSPFR
jgi:hypothetical protein